MEIVRKERDAVRGREGEKEEKEFKGFVEEAREVVRCAICGKKTDKPKIFGNKFYCEDCFYIDIQMVGDGVGI